MRKPPLVEPEKIKVNLKWTDPEVYRWEIGQTAEAAGQPLLVPKLIAALNVSVIVFFLFVLLSLLSTSFAFWAASAVTVFYILFYLIELFGLHRTTKGEGQSKGRYIHALAFTGAFAYLLYSPGLFREGLAVPQDAGAWIWAKFYLAQLADVLLFGAPEMLGYRLTEITPQTDLAKLSLVVLRVFMVLGLVETFAHAFKHYFFQSKQVTYGTVQDGFWAACRIPGVRPGQVNMTRGGRMQPLRDDVGTDAASFTAVYRERARRERKAGQEEAARQMREKWKAGRR